MNFIRQNINVFPYWNIFFSTLDWFDIQEFVLNYDPCLYQGRSLINKLMLQGFLPSPLKSALLTLYGNYNDLVCHYYLPLDKLLTLPSHTLYLCTFYLFLVFILGKSSCGIQYSHYLTINYFVFWIHLKLSIQRIYNPCRMADERLNILFMTRS
jgi:hypothetical protein